MLLSGLKPQSKQLVYYLVRLAGLDTSYWIARIAFTRSAILSEQSSSVLSDSIALPAMMAPIPISRG